MSKRALAKYLATLGWADHRGGLPGLSRHLSQSPLHDRGADRFDPGGRGHPKAAAADPKEFFDNRFMEEIEDNGFIQERSGKREEAVSGE